MNGYCSSHQSFNTLDLDQFNEALGGFVFSGKGGKRGVDLTGLELLEISNDYNNKNYNHEYNYNFYYKACINDDKYNYQFPPTFSVHPYFL